MEALGAELVADWDMEAVGVGDWVASNSTLSKVAGSPGGSGTQFLRVTRTSAASSALASQVALFSAGVRYRAKGLYRGDSNAVDKPRVRDTSGSIDNIGLANDTWQDFIDMQEITANGSLQLRTSATSGTVGHWVDFDNISFKAEDLSAWTPNSGAVLTKEVGSPGSSGDLVLRVTTLSGDSQAQARQDVLTAGKTYRVSGWARTDGAAGVEAEVFIGGVNAGTVSSSNTWAYFEKTATAGSATFLLNTKFLAATSDAWTEWDNISVREVIDPPLGPELVVDGDMEALGAELLTNGDFENEGTGWIEIGTPTVTYEDGAPSGSGSKYAKIQTNGGGGVGLRQTNVATIGNRYIFVAHVASDGTSLPRFYDGGAYQWTGTNESNWYRQVVAYQAAGAHLRIVTSGAAGLYSTWDNVSLRAEDLSAWTPGNSATLTKEAGSPWGGDLVLRVARNGVNNPFATQSTISIGKTYRVCGYLRSDGLATARVRDSSIVLASNTTSSWQWFCVDFTATTTNLNFNAATTVDGQWAEFDNISVREVL
jgi:hypothetical protein